MIRLRAEECLVIWSRVDDVLAGGVDARAMSWLADDERARLAELATKPLQREFLATRALGRSLLGALTGAAPAALRFQAGTYGKPELTFPESHGLAFNLTNSHGLVACALTRGHQVGVDAEYADPAGAPLAVSERYFSVPELAALRALPPSRQSERFYQLWTLKEAYIKALGTGLAASLTDFWLTLAPGAAPALGPDPAGWSFANFVVDGAYQLSVAVEGLSAAAIRIEQAATPLTP